MDPVSATGLASSILTFVDFAWKITHGIYETYQSANGLSSEHAHLDDVVQDFHSVTEGLRHENVDPESPHVQELKSLATDCAKIFQKLLRVLASLRRKDGNKLWRSLQTTWERMRKDSEIRVIEATLGEYRTQIFLRLHLNMRDHLSTIESQQKDIQRQGLRLPDEERTRLSYIQSSLKKLADDFERERSESARFDANGAQLFEPIRDLNDALETMITELRKTPPKTTADNAILQRLFLGKTDAREHHIESAEYGTFEWLVDFGDMTGSEGDDNDGSSDEFEDAVSCHSFASSTSYQHFSDAVSNQSSSDLSVTNTCSKQSLTTAQLGARDSFGNWLRSGSGLYHISGKAGSGKSTLMKLLSRHPGVEKELKHWSGDQNLVVARFFFWASGDPLEKSLEGLYQSILHQILQECPELIRETFPQDWEATNTDPASARAFKFTLPELRDAIKSLATKTFAGHRFCFFIDGLDGYHGDSTDHLRLARELSKWSNSPDIKICASSRPHMEFLETFSCERHPTLHLHEITAEDIAHFVSEAILDEDPRKRNSSELGKIVNHTTLSANGVFLWARLVTRSTCEGIRHGDSTPVLLQKLSHTPQGLGALFDQLFRGIHAADRQRSDKIFLIATTQAQEASSGPMLAISYSWIDEVSDPEFPLRDPICGLSDDEVQKRLDLVCRQLRILTKGLLELRDTRPTGHRSGYEIELFFTYDVDFYHRSVQEFLQEPDKLSSMRQRLGSFDCQDVLRRLELVTYQFSSVPPRKTRVYDEYSYYGLMRRCLEMFSKPLLPVGDHLFLNLAKRHHQVFNDLWNNSRGRVMGRWNIFDRTRFFLIAADDYPLSYMSHLAFNNSWAYLRHLVAQDPSLAIPLDDNLAPHDVDRQGTGLSLLLSVFVSGAWGFAFDLSIIELLLEAGASPNHNVVVKSFPRDTGLPTSRSTTIWAIFLCFFSRELEYSKRPHERKKNLAAWFKLLELFVNAGGDGDCIFVYERDRPDHSVASGSEEEALTQQTLREQTYITLKNLGGHLASFVDDKKPLALVGGSSLH